MDLLFNVAAFVVALGILVTFHEFGHYIIARRSGVHIVRFSVGFGRPIFSRTDRRGTEFTIAAIPLGGYVRMLDDRVEEVPPEFAGRTYNKLSVGWRIAIAFGGPIANFILAIIAYWLVFVGGTTELIPVVGEITQSSVAQVSGMEANERVVAVDGATTESWQDVQLGLARRLGETGQIEITTMNLGSTRQQTYTLPINDWLIGVDEPDFMGDLGFKPTVPAMAGEVIEGGAAAKAGLLPLDWVTRVDDEKIDSWQAWVKKIQQSPGVALNLTVQRNGSTQQIVLTPESRTSDAGETIGFVGVAPPRHLVKYGLVDSVGLAIQETADKTLLTLGLLKKMVVGQVSVKNLSGPLTIATVAGDSARLGWQRFVFVMALLSISLGVLNLLPIPILDGGHILFCLVEMVRGKPVSERVQNLGMQVGLFLVGSLMLLAIYNDFTRIF